MVCLCSIVLWYIISLSGSSDATTQGASTATLITTGVLIGAIIGIIATISLISTVVLIMKYKKRRGKTIALPKYEHY